MKLWFLIALCAEAEKRPKWNNWSEWSACSQSCGRNSVQRQCSKVLLIFQVSCQLSQFSSIFSRNRVCPTVGECKGKANQLKRCRLPKCPKSNEKPNQWSEWSPWANCQGTCTKAWEKRKRSCRGKKCPGKRLQKQKCVPRIESTHLKIILILQNTSQFDEGFVNRGLLQLYRYQLLHQ